MWNVKYAEGHGQHISIALIPQRVSCQGQRQRRREGRVATPPQPLDRALYPNIQDMEVVS